jgi:hypothetical protein
MCVAPPLIRENETWYEWLVRESWEPLPFDNLALPLIRQLFPPLSVKEILSVQPMTSPTALTFYMDYKYGQT